MGNLCGKESAPDPFSTPGRTLSSAPPPSNTRTSAVPKKVGGPPRMLGSASNSAPASGGGEAAEDARRKAAAAAEARANIANKPKGKLGSQLLEQKKQTRVDTLDQASRDELRARDADAAAEARAYN